MNETLDFSVFASVRNFTFLSRVLLVDARDVLPSADTTTGRSLQKHSQDPGFQNIARATGPLPSIRTRPVSPGRRVQSFNLSPSARRVKGWAAATSSPFVRPALPATSGIYSISGVWAREAFRNFLSLARPPPIPATALEDISLENRRQPRAAISGRHPHRAWTRREPRRGMAPEDTEPPRVFSRGFL